ncbi:unnamed protein product [Cylicocyclus nassatus]|uniref:Uncharacterized protein n=1 Tax=Cylicocyclus nassatus TaxID=53992 RepID=A0AA36GBW5_CYLNA|nr:unnamed protein product [Cylicocyclus nassatus]
MMTNATGFLEKFPGLKPTVLTLNGRFYFPFRREIGIGFKLKGGVEASRESLQYLLENPRKGRAIAIVLGGSQELLDARPGAHVLYLSSLRGFCRFALQYGADLVPMYNFGENDVFNTISSPRGTALRNFQEFIKSWTGFCPPLANGRGIFNYTFSLLPHRRPIATVMGAPTRVDRVENPTREEDKLHAEYCKALTELFEAHKSLHNVPNDAHLTIY